MSKNKRNKLATKAGLIKAALEDIVKNGFKSLSGAKLAERAGRHGSRITNLFGGLGGLIKATVAEHDHWDLLFKKFSIPKDAGEKETRKLFAGLMATNFSAFKENTDMQHMILGQMSVKLEVLQEISAYRELEGAKLLDRTDRYFEGSGVCFRTVIGLLLYGSYGLVLHARHTGGTVAGKDINKEEDLKVAKQTIANLIELAWKDASKKRKKSLREKMTVLLIAGILWTEEVQNIPMRFAEGNFS